MEKTIRCPECGSNVVPDVVNTCPTCSYRFKRFDYQQQGLNESDFTGLQEFKINSRFFGKAKIIGFLVVLFFIIFKLFSQ